MKINSVSVSQRPYIQILSEIPQPPQRIFYLGNIPSERVPTVAIVGTRKPTAYGREVTYRLAYDLAAKGVVIVSGLAYGIDAIAHQAALDAGGSTIAVMAGGLDTIYPRAHQALAQKIIEKGGALISEYEPGILARDFQFLERNRIVSGLADAVIVTEAASRSGTLATIRHALDQGREVFAVPGNITSPASVGPNNTLRQGAHVATSAEDILSVIAPELLETQASLALGNTPAETTILQLIQAGTRDGDQLQQQSYLTVSEFAQTLTMLEIQGAIRPLGGNQWTIR